MFGDLRSSVHARDHRRAARLFSEAANGLDWDVRVFGVKVASGEGSDLNALGHEWAVRPALEACSMWEKALGEDSAASLARLALGAKEAALRDEEILGSTARSGLLSDEARYQGPVAFYAAHVIKEATLPLDCNLNLGAVICNLAYAKAAERGDDPSELDVTNETYATWRRRWGAFVLDTAISRWV